MTTTRRLAAILAADVAGYSAAMERDEEGTAAAVRALRREVIEPKLAEHHGRLIKTTGDGFLAEFASPIAALKCALAIQQRPDDGGLRLRMGLNLGDVIIEEGGDLLGEGVNIAARLEGLAEPGGILVSDKIVREVEGKVDAAFDDRGEQHVKNISKPVRAYAVRIGAQATAKLPALGKPLPLPDKPSIAVLPFQNMSSDPEQEYFADGVVEEIITALSRFKQLFVIARNSSFTYKGKSVDIKQVARELGVRYVLEGSIRKSGERVRITGQLIEAATGAHLWADKFDGELQDVFALQDKVTGNIVGAIAPKIEQTEIEGVRYRPVQSFGAYDQLLRAMAAIYQLTAASTTDALQRIDEALKHDPNSGAAHSLKAFCYTWRFFSGWMSNTADERAEAERHARRALELAKDDAAVLAYSGYTLGVLNGELEDGAALLDRALYLNPNLALGWAASAWLNVYRGNMDRAIEQAMQALRLSPVDLNIQSIRNLIGTAHFYAGRYDEAVMWARLSLQAKADFLPSLRLAAAAEAQAGNQDAAQQFTKRLQLLDPKASVSSIPRVISSIARSPAPGGAEHYARMKDGLRKAGLPE